MLFANRSTLVATASIALLLGGCAKYRPHDLNKPLFVSTNTSSPKLEGAAEELSASECKRIFSRDAVRKGYRVVHLALRNNSNKKIYIDTNDIDLSITRRTSVINDLSLNTGKRFASLFIPGLFVIGLILLPCSVVEAHKCSKANKALSNDFYERVLDRDETLVIPPNRTVQKVIFTQQRQLPAILSLDYYEQGGNEIMSLDIPLL